MKNLSFFLILFLFFFISCQNDKPTEPEEIPEETSLAEATIGPSGGELKTEEFILSVPEGAFFSETKLKLFIDLHDDIHSSSRLTQVYVIEGFPKIFYKPLKLKIKLDLVPDDTIALTMGSEALDPTTGLSEYNYKYFPAQDSSNYLICELPEIIEGTATGLEPLYKIREDFTDKIKIWVREGVTYLRYEHFQIGIGKEEPVYLFSSIIVLLEDIFNNLNNLLDYAEDEIKKQTKISFPLVLSLNANSIVDNARPNRYCSFTRDLAIDPTDNQKQIATGFNLHMFRYKLNDGNLPLIIRDLGHYLYMFYPLIFYTNSYEKSEQFWLHHAIATWSEERFPQIDNFVPLDFPQHFNAPFAGIHISGEDTPQHVESHGIGMAPLIKHLAELNQETIISKIFRNLKTNEVAVDAILNSVPDENIWLPNFFKKYISGNIYNVSSDKFLNMILEKNVFKIEKETEILKYFDRTYNDLSAKLFRIDLLNKNIKEKGMLNFKIGPTSLNLDYVKALVFGLKDGNFVFLNEGTDFSVSDLQQYNTLVACVVNSGNEPPYTEASNITLDVRVISPPELNYNWCEIHFSADGTYDSNPINELVSVVGEGMGSFTGNKFEAIWNNMPTCMRDSGSITATIDPTTLMASYSVVTTLRDTCYGNNITYKSFFEGSNIPLQKTADNKLTFEVQGSDACNYVSSVEKVVDYGNGNRWTLLSHDCTNYGWFFIELKNK